MRYWTRPTPTIRPQPPSTRSDEFDNSLAAAPGGTFSAVAACAWAKPLAPESEGAHGVQLYEQDDFLAESVASFVAPAIVSEGSAIIIGTRRHRDAVHARLTERGVELAAARTTGRYITIDAAELLGEFIVDGLPDRARFEAAVGGMLSAASRAGRRVRVFDEMAALLGERGNGAGAHALEALWHDAGRSWNFRLLCGHPLGGWADERPRDDFRPVRAAPGLPAPAASRRARSDETLRRRPELRPSNP